MDFPLQADIFFVVATVAIVLVGGGILYIFRYLIPAARDLRRLAHRALEEGDKVIADVDVVRHKIKAEVLETNSLFELIRAIFGRGQRKRRVSAH